MSDEDEEIDPSVLERYRDDVDHPLATLFRDYGLEHAHWFAVGVLTSTLARFLSLVPPVVLGIAIDSIFRDDKPFAVPYVPGAWLPTDPAGQFLFALAIMGVAGALEAAMNFARSSTMNLFSHRVKHEARVACYKKMQRLDMAFFDDRKTGELMSILNNDTNRLELFLDNMMGAAIQLGVLVLGIALVLFYYNWQLALVTMAMIPVAAGFTRWFMNLVEDAYSDVRSSVGDLNTLLENNLAGIEVIKTANTVDHEDERVEAASYEYFERDWKTLRLNFIYRPGMQLLTSVAFVITFAVGGVWVMSGPPLFFSGTLSVGELVTFLLLTQRMVEPLTQMSEIVDRYEDAKASTRRILGLMAVPVSITDPDDAETLDDPAGRVEYDDVRFRYGDVAPDPGEEPDRGTGGDAVATDDTDVPDSPAKAEAGDEWVLKDVDFVAEPGETVGLVGPTGAGKTTILKLLTRLYDVDGGAIRVDGHDVRDLTLDSLRGAVGYVSQDTFLFDGTVRENIRYGTFDADDEAIREAAKMAEAHEFIANLPDGYDTRVGERGVKLSGGQRQRIAIARTVLADPPILVFDEATSDVDTETEMLIQRSLDTLAEDRTTFAIAHRLSTVRDADTILVVEDGEIVERGTHEELIAADGLYADLWAVQAGDLDALSDEFVENAAQRASAARFDGSDD